MKKNFAAESTCSGDRMKLKHLLRIVWANEPPKRYLPKSLDGGTGWRVFDGRTSKFLSDNELKRVLPDSLATETVTH